MLVGVWRPFLPVSRGAAAATSEPARPHTCAARRVMVSSRRGENRGSRPGAQPPSGEVIDTLPLKGEPQCQARWFHRRMESNQDFRGNHPITVATF